jgi:hypothetical protein
MVNRDQGVVSTEKSVRHLEVIDCRLGEIFDLMAEFIAQITDKAVFKGNKIALFRPLPAFLQFVEKREERALVLCSLPTQAVFLNDLVAVGGDF